MRADALAPRLLGLALVVGLSGCSGIAPFEPEDGAPGRPVDVSSVPDAVPRVEPRARSGNPPSYVVNGRRYYVRDSATGYRKRGVASWYGTKFHGRRTSSGERYDMYTMTAAHRSLPLPTYARVTNLRNGRQVVVRINDRGPFHPTRIIDLSYAAAKKLGIVATGTGLVEVEAIVPGQPAPPPPQHATTITATGSSPAPGLYLQVGAFISRNNAERLKSRLNGSAVGQVHIQAAPAGDTEVFRVRLGPLANVAQADRLAETLARLGIADPRIVIE